MSGLLRSWRWELILVGLTLLAGTWASLTSPFYLSVDQISYSLQESIGVTGLIAAGLMAIVVVAEIDISLPAIMALGNVLFASLALRGVPIGLALPLVLWSRPPPACSTASWSPPSACPRSP